MLYIPLCHVPCFAIYPLEWYGVIWPLENHANPQTEASCYLRINSEWAMFRMASPLFLVGAKSRQAKDAGLSSRLNVAWVPLWCWGCVVSVLVFIIFWIPRLHLYWYHGTVTASWRIWRGVREGVVVGSLGILGLCTTLWKELHFADRSRKILFQLFLCQNLWIQNIFIKQTTKLVFHGVFFLCAAPLVWEKASCMKRNCDNAITSKFIEAWCAGFKMQYWIYLMFCVKEAQGF